MKSMRFWIYRYLTVMLGAFALLAVCYLLRGMETGAALREAALWGSVSATVLVAVRYRQARRGIACALCRDTLPD